MPTALDIITRAYKIAGILGKNETPDSGMAADGMTSLNDMLDSWNTDRTFIYTISTTSITVTGAQSYTIGIGGDFNTDRPEKLENVYVRINNIDYPLKQINIDDWDSIAYKASGSFPQYFRYEPNYPLGVIYIYGAPTTGSIYIDIWSQLTQFSSISDNHTFPNGYRRALNYGLAKEIAPENGISLTPEAAAIAVESQANIRARNLPLPVMKTEVGALVGNNIGFNGWRGY